jgi:hypothetical protein
MMLAVIQELIDASSGLQASGFRDSVWVGMVEWDGGVDSGLTPLSRRPNGLASDRAAAEEAEEPKGPETPEARAFRWRGLQR